MPKWAVPLGDGAIGAVRSPMVLVLSLLAAALCALVAIGMPVDTIVNNEDERDPLTIGIIAAVFGVVAIAMVLLGVLTRNKVVLRIDDVGVHRVGGILGYALLPWHEISEITWAGRSHIIKIPRGWLKRNGSRGGRTLYFQTNAFRGGSQVFSYLQQRWADEGGHRPVST